MLDENSRLFKASEVKVYLGVHNITVREKSKHIQMRLARFVSTHASFDHKSLDNDIGLIQLKRVVKMNGMDLLSS